MKISGFCPMGCGETLCVRVGETRVVCAAPDCLAPDAVDRILSENEYDHLVTFDKTGFIIKHPLRERLDNELANCVAHAWVADLVANGYRKKPGTYRAWRDHNGWQFA